MLAFSNARTARSNRSRTFSTARIIRCHEIGAFVGRFIAARPATERVAVVASGASLLLFASNTAIIGGAAIPHAQDKPRVVPPDDDTPAEITFAAGGQAANVATWVSALGGRATLFGPRSDHGHGGMVEAALSARGVSVVGPHVDRPGTVVSLVTSGTRSMASDPGDPTWLRHVAAGPWLAGADWLFVYGYALLRSDAPDLLVEVARVARSAGALRSSTTRRVPRPAP